MSVLTKQLPITDRYGTPINYSFRNMIQVEQLVYEDIPTGDKAYQQLRLLYGDEIPYMEDIHKAWDELIWFFGCGRDGEDVVKTQSSKSNHIEYDFDIDADKILASFQSAYNIDLMDRPSMHWWQFVPLFACLPEDCIMSRYRFMRNPKTDGMTAKEKKRAEAQRQKVEIKRKRISHRTTKESIEQGTLEHYKQKNAEAWK